MHTSGTHIWKRPSTACNTESSTRSTFCSNLHPISRTRTKCVCLCVYVYGHPRVGTCRQCVRAMSVSMCLCVYAHHVGVCSCVYVYVCVYLPSLLSPSLFPCSCMRISFLVPHMGTNHRATRSVSVHVSPSLCRDLFLLLSLLIPHTGIQHR